MLGILLIGALAAAVFPPALLPSDQFLPAGIAILLTVRLYGTRWGLAAALLAGTCTFILQNDLVTPFIYVSEALVVGMLLRRGMRSLLSACAIFWIFFGLPLTWLKHSVFFGTSPDELLLPLLIPVGNGLFNALAATLLLRFSPLLRWRDRMCNTLWESQFNLVMGCFILPVMLMVLVNLNAPRDFLNSDHRTYLQRTLAGDMAIMLAPALLALFLIRNISRKITKPLEELARVTSDLPERLKSDEELEWPASVGIEVDALVRNFRALAEEVERSYRESRKVGAESGKVLDDITAQRNWEVFTAGRKLKSEMDRRKRIEELLSELEMAESKYRFLVEKTLVGVYFLSGNRLSYVNPRFAEIFGYRPEELTSTDLIDLVSKEDRVLVAGNLRRQALGEVNNLQFQFRGVRKDGSHIHVEVLSGKGAYEGQTAILGTLMDITARVEAEQTIEHMAYHDPLTGLPNRLLFADRAHQALNYAMRNQQMIGMLFLDLDHFKNVNDTLGHAAGDQLLKSMTERLHECLRDSDTIGRFGGDEFNILVTQMKQESDASLVAHKILRAMSFPFHIEGHEIYLTCSIGIALYPRDCQDVQGLIKNADTALYRAKDLGRNNYQIYSPSMNARALERMAMENSLRRVLERNELRVHYQAQVNLQTGRIIGMEALVRWEHEIGEMIQPSAFIPLAEKIGVIAPIGEWVLRTACHQARDWQQEGFPPLRVGINVSAAQLQDPKFADVVTHIVAESKIDPKWINLEITESVVMEDVKEAVGKFRQLHEVGITVAIDDFGIGYSSLSYLRNFPVDQLKMDRSFVQNLPRESNDANIARHIIAMAQEVGLSVIAEGIETPEQFEFLRSLGCNEGQGFLLSKPLPPEEFAQLLRGEKTFSYSSDLTESSQLAETAASTT